MLTLSGSHFNEIFRYPIQGKDWFVKVGLQGAVLLLLCPFLVGIPFLTGFLVLHTQRGIVGSTDYPDWDNWGTYWTLGWKAIAVNFLYYLPILLLVGAYIVVVVFSMLLGAITNEPDLAAIGGIFSMFGMFTIYPVLFAYMICYLAIQMAAGPKLAAGASLTETLSWTKYLWPYIKANALNLLLVYLIGYLVSLVASLGIFLMFIGIMLTMPFAMVLLAYAQGVVYRLSTVK